jgi:hypothetical protein
MNNVFERLGGNAVIREQSAAIEKTIVSRNGLLRRDTPRNDG